MTKKSLTMQPISFQANPNRRSFELSNFSQNIFMRLSMLTILMMVTCFSYALDLVYNSNGASGGTVPTTVTGIVSGGSTNVAQYSKTGLYRTGFSFGGWNTNAAGTGTRYYFNSSITLTANTTLFAQWIPKTVGVAGGNGNNALSFDGVDDYVSMPSGYATTSSSFTVEAWVYPTETTNWSRIIQIGSTANSNSNSIYLLSSTGSTGKPAFGVNEEVITATQQIPLNQWTHIAATINGTSVALYINGELNGTKTFTNAFSQNVSHTANYIGKSGWSSDGYFKGKMDEVRTWTSQRTAAQIKGSMYDELKGDETALLSYFTFNQGTAAGTNTGIVNLFEMGTDEKNGTLNNFALSGASSNYIANDNSLFTNYTVTYNTNGATGAPSVASFTDVYNNTFTLATVGTMAKANYTFMGWNTFADTTGNDFAAGSSSTIPSANRTFYAKWRLNTYYITYNPNGSTGGTPPPNGAAKYNTSLLLSSNSGSLVRTGYTFSGWNTANSGVQQQIPTLGKPATQNSTGHGGDASRAIDGNTNQQWGGGSITHNNCENQGWWQLDLQNTYFIGSITIWNRLDCCNDRLQNFHILTSAVPFTSQDLATTLRDPNVSSKYVTNEVYVYGNRNFLINKDARYVRIQLAGQNCLSLAEVQLFGSAGTNYAVGTFFLVTSDVTLFANWTINSYAVNYDGNGNTGGAAPANNTATYNTAVTLATNSGALVRTGYTFVGWNTSADTTGTNYAAGASFTIPGNATTLYAKWRPVKYTITYNGNSSTSGTVPAVFSGVIYQTFTIPENTGNLVRSGFTFAGWNTNAAGTGTSYAPGSTYTITSANVSSVSSTGTVGDLPIFTPSMAIVPFGSVSSSGNEQFMNIKDGNVGTKYLDFSAGDGMGFTVNLGGTARTATKIAITTANDGSSRDPKNFEVFGSNDGVNFTSVGTGTIPCIGTRFFTRTFDISNTSPYLHYRVNVTNTCGDGMFQLAEVQLFESISTTNLYAKWNCGSTSTSLTVANTDNQKLCLGSPITNILYNTTGFTSIGTPTNLPAGVTAVYSTVSNTLTISGTPTVSGTFNYSIPLIAGCGTTYVTGKIVVANAPGNFGNALDFDGSNDYVKSTNSSSLQLNTTGTIEAWIKTSNAGSSYRGIVVKPYAYGLFLKDGILIAHDFTSGDKSTGINLADNKWHHVALAFNAGVTDGSYIYIDGELKLTTTYRILNQNESLFIGTNLPNTGQDFKGSIDEVRVWGTQRTQSQIRSSLGLELAGTESGLVSYFDFNHGIAAGTNTTVTTLSDRTSNANNGTVTNMALTGTASNFVANSFSLDAIGSSAAGVFKNAMDFDGVNDNIIASNTNSLKISSGTVEAWIKTSNAGASYRGIVVKPVAYGLFMKDNILMVYDWTVGDKSTGINLADNNWHHVAFTFNSGVANGSYVYIDGVLRFTTTYTISNQNYELFVGANTVGAGQDFKGTIDEVRVWNTPRTQAQIQQSMGAPLAGTESGLVSYFDFNQGIAAGTNTALTTLTDRSGNANNGRISNFALTGTTSNFVENTNIVASTSSAITVCVNGTNQLRTNLLGGVWSLSDSTNATISSTGLLTGLSVGTTTANYTFTSSNGCTTKKTALITVKVKSTSSQTVSACGSYAWKGTTYTTSGAKTWIGTSAIGCDSVVTLNLTINAFPASPVVSSSVASCIGVPITLSATSTPGTVVDWYQTATSSTPLLSGSNTFTTPNLSANATYYLVARDTVTGCVSAQPGVTNALNFDGSNDYLTAKSGVYFNGNFTIESWVYVRSFANWSRIIDFGNGAGNNCVLLSATYGTGGYPGFYVGGAQFQANRQLTLNKWNHVAATLNGTTATIYVNGQASGTANFPVPANVTRTKCLIGASNWGDPVFNGIMDELSIWNVALTPAQIQSSMFTQLTGSEAGLVAYYNFNEGTPGGTNSSITSLTDLTSNANHATFSNFALTGSTSNFVAGYDSIVANSRTKITITVSAGSSTYDTSRVNITNGATSYTWNGTVYTASGTYVRTSGCAVSVLILKLCSPSASSESVTACGSYLWKGVTYTTSGAKTWSGTNATGCDSVVTLNLTINAMPAKPVVTNGSICAGNTVTLIATSTAGTEVDWYETLSSTTPLLAGSNTFTTPSLSSSTSYYVVARDVTTGCLSAQAGSSNAINFDGVNDGIEASTIGNTTSITVETWVKFDQTNGFQFLAAKRDNSSGAGNYELGIQDGKIYGAIYFTPSGYVQLRGTTTLVTGQWYHVAYSFSPNYVGYYLNGVLEVGAQVSNQINNNAQQIFRMSGGSSRTSELLKGSLDNYRIWNVARTQAEIVANMNSELNASSGLVASYDFNQGIAGGNNAGLTTLIDRTGNGNNGTLYGFGLNGSSSNWVNGVVGNSRTTVTATINALPTILTSSRGANICETGTTTLSATTSTRAKIDWYDSATGGFLMALGTNAFTTPTISTNTTYYAEARDTVTGCTSATRTALTAIVASHSNSSSITETACGSYLWNGVTYTTSGAKTWTGQNAVGCDSVVILNLTINAIPAIPVVTNGARCAAGTVTLSATSTTGTEVDWYQTSTSTTPLFSASNTFTTPSISSSTSYYVVARDIATGCLSMSAENNALNIDGSNRFAESSLNPTSNFTIETWAKGTGSYVGYHMIAGKWVSPENLEASVTDKKARITIVTSTGVFDLSGSTILNIDQWYHLAFTYDGSSLKVYVNGVLDGTKSTTGTIINNTQTFKIGATRNGTNGSYNWTGSFDNYRVWSLARTGTEILTEMNNTLSSGIGLMASYDFNQGVAGGNNTGNTTLNDISGNGNTATLRNFILNGTTSNFVAGNSSILRNTRTTITATINALPTVVTSSRGANICATGTTTLSATASTRSKIDWYDSETGGVLLASGTNTFTTPTISTNTTYYAESRDTVTGCISATRTAVTANVVALSTSSTTTQSACNTFRWNNTTYTTSGVYTYNTINAAGCDSFAIVNLTIKYSTSSSRTETVCNSFLWNGTTYTTSGIKTFTTTNAVGCDSVATLNLTVNYRSTSTSSITVCNLLLWNGVNYTTSGVYTYTTTNAVGCDSVATLNLTVKYGSTSTRTESICNSFLWNGITYTNSGVYTYTTTNAVGCDSVATLNLTVRKSSSSVANVSACITYVWNGVTYSTAGTRTWNGTNAAGCDSIAVLNLTIAQNNTYSTIDTAICTTTSLPFTFNGTSIPSAGTYTITLRKADGCDSIITFIVTVNSVKPTAPTGITQTLVSNNCAARVYRFTVTSAVANAYGYRWLLPTSVGGVSGVAIDSGNINRSRTIKVKFTSNAAALTRDSIKVLAFSGCGNSEFKGVKLTNAILNPPLSPSTIIGSTLVSNNCGETVYRFFAPSLPLGTATNGAATGYIWSLNISSTGTIALLDSGTLNSGTIVVRYTNANSTNIGDTIKLSYSSACGNGAVKSTIYPKPVIYLPLSPVSVTSELVSDVCGARVYRYKVSELPAVTNVSYTAATGYAWTMPYGALGQNGVLDSGSLSGQVIKIKYSSNAAAVVGDSIKVSYTSSCGNSIPKAIKLTNTLLTVPVAPLAITSTLVANNCGSKTYRYTAPDLTTATLNNIAASGYVWTINVSRQGSSTSLDSGSLSSKSIVVTYNNATNISTGDSIKLAFTSECGLSANKIIIFPNPTVSAPLAPTSISTSLVSDNCGARVYRYTAPSLPTVTNSANTAANGYAWSLPIGLVGSTGVLDSGTLSSRIIRIKYTSSAAASIGDSIKVAYTSTCGNSSVLATKLTNIVYSSPTVQLTAPTSITQTLVSNTCNAKVYRYSVALPSSNTMGYQWSLPIGTVGSTGALDSGVLTSRVICIKYSSNAAAGLGDSIKVGYTTNCGNTPLLSTKLTKIALTTFNVPLAPTLITSTLLVNNCGEKVYRYVAPSLPIATATSVAASGYSWSFNTNAVGSSAVLDSGSADGKTIVIRYFNNSSVSIGDSVSLAYTSGCGISANKKMIFANPLVKAPTSPASITVELVSNVCGERVYRYKAAALTSTINLSYTAANGYAWLMPTGSLGSTGILDSGSLSSQTIRVKYSSNAGASAGDSISVSYTSSCGNSLNKVTPLTNVVLTVPVAPIAITSTLVLNNCGEKVYRYVAPSLPIATATTVAANGYKWLFNVNRNGSNATLDSGSMESKVIVVSYSNGTSVSTGDSISLAYTSTCGVSTNRTMIFPNPSVVAPLAPTSITTQLVSDICGARVYRYAATAIASVTASGYTPATGYAWTMPFGNLGSTGVLDSGTLGSQIIKIRYSSNAGSATGDSIKVAFTSSCGNSKAVAMKLTNTLLVTSVIPTPAVVLQELILNKCGEKVYRYTAPSLVTNTTGYQWQMPVGNYGSFGTLDSGTLTSKSIVVKYTTNLTAGAGDTVRVAFRSNCGVGTYRSLALLNPPIYVPLTPTDITSELVSDACGARVYRFKSTPIPGVSNLSYAAATGYAWLMPTGPLANTATLDSGTLGSQIIRIAFNSNAPASINDSIKVAYTSSCGNSLFKAIRLPNVKVTAPAAPANITTTLLINNCSEKVYRYVAPSLPAATQNTWAATGYAWSFNTLSLGSSATLDSGSLEGQAIIVRYFNSSTVSVGDSIGVSYTSSCGNSANKIMIFPNPTVSAPLMPTSITAELVSDVCGARVYRYKASTLPSVTNMSFTAATGYAWSMPIGTLGLTGVLDSGSLGSQTIKIKYSSNAPANIGDSIKLAYTSSCGNSRSNVTMLSNIFMPATVIPTPGAVFQELKLNNCGEKVYRYTVPTLATNASGYKWEMPTGAYGTLGTLDSGTLTSKSILIRFNTDAIAGSGDSVKVAYTSICGMGAFKTLGLITPVIYIPNSPASITTELVSNECGARIYRYKASELPAVNNLSYTAATGYAWSMPYGPLGSNGVLDSGSLGSQTIRIKYSSNAGVSIGDSIKVAYTTSCGNTPFKLVNLSNTNLSVPAMPSSMTSTVLVNNCSEKVYRYVASVLPGATQTTGAGTGYLWSMPEGSLGSIGTLDSGSLDSKAIIVRYASNVAASAGDSIKLAYTSLCGNSLYKAFSLTNAVAHVPASPSNIITTLLANNCGEKVYRYTAPTLPAANQNLVQATGYVWSLFMNSGSRVILDSGSYDSKSIIVRYYINSLVNVDDSIALAYTSNCGISLNKSILLPSPAVMLPSSPSSITAELVSDECGARVYRYKAANFPNIVNNISATPAIGYAWMMPIGPLGEMGDLDSGSLSSQTIRIKYRSNNGASAGDSIKVAFTTSSCGISAYRTTPLTNIIKRGLAAPTSISTTLLSNNCGEKVYRYVAPNLTPATNSTVAATSYAWSFNIYEAGSTLLLDSGTMDGKAIIVRYFNNASSSVGDSISVAFNSVCGLSTNRTIVFPNPVVNAPFSPASITTELVSDVCGERVYRYAVSSFPTITNMTYTAATGYSWLMPIGTLGSTGVLDSGSLYSKTIKIRYANTAAARIGDSIKVAYTSSCGISPYKAVMLSNSNIVTIPAAPANITATLLVNNCSEKVYRYVAPVLPAATQNTMAATGYMWSYNTLTLGSSASIDSGDIEGRAIIVRYFNSSSESIGDSIGVTYTSACGNSETKSIIFPNPTVNAPLAPVSITTELVEDYCGSRVYRYKAASMPGITNMAHTAATGYAWSMPIGTLGLNGQLDSGTLGSQTIRIRYSSNAGATAGDSIQVSYTSSCGNSNARTVMLSNITLPLSVVPTPASITQTLVLNNCGEKAYRYTMSEVQGTAIVYQWSMPEGNYGSTGVIDSGSLNSKTIIVRYVSNSLAGAGDSIRAAFSSGCALSAYRTLGLINTASFIPLKPAGMTVDLVSDDCGARVYRYSAPALASVNNLSYTAATGYAWSMPIGALGSTGLLDSGSLSSQKILIKYSSNAEAAEGDSIKVAYTSSCGNSSALSMKLTNILLSNLSVQLTAPNAITQTLVSNYCGDRVYRYTATAGQNSAIGYAWVMPIGTVGSTGVLDSGSLSSQTIRIKYPSNEAAATGDSIKVAYTSVCGTGYFKAVKLINTLLTAPIAPISISSVLLVNNCGEKVYRYTAPALFAPATGYAWTMGINSNAIATIDSGSAEGNVVVVRYLNTASSFIGDSIKVAYNSGCGIGASKSMIFPNPAVNVPFTPASITAELVSDVCGARVYRYKAPVLPGVSNLSFTAPTGYAWSMPVGTLGATGTLDSGSLGSQAIRIIYSSNAAATSGDSIRLAYTSTCGNSANKAIRLSNLLKTGCLITKNANPIAQTPTETVSTKPTEMMVKVYPNPSRGAFKIALEGNGKDTKAKIRDLRGLVLKTLTINANQTIELGNDLKPGIYFLEVNEGNKTKTVRLVKF